MVHFERKDSENARAAIKSLERAKKSNGRYNTESVKAALREIFYDKCYICEDGTIQTAEVEHLIPHGGNADLKYDWNNLYWACRHCNSIKGERYAPILDCCSEKVDLVIAFRVFFDLKNYNHEIEIKPQGNSPEIDNTCRLLNDVYYGTSRTKRGARVKRREVVKKVSEFMEYVRKYLSESNEEKKQDLRQYLEKELSNRSEYTAFKRWIIRDNPVLCKDLMSLLPY